MTNRRSISGCGGTSRNKPNIPSVLYPHGWREIFDLKSNYRPWTDKELDKLKALIASGASAFRASAALKRSRPMIKLKARDLGVPFPSEAKLRAKRRQLFQNSADGPRVSVLVRAKEDI